MKNKIKKVVLNGFLGLSLSFFFGSIALAGWSIPGSGGDFGLPTATIYDIISNIANWVLEIIGFVGIIGFVISGILYLTSAGESGQADKAKEAMKYSIIGVIVALAGFVAIQAADAILNARNI